MLPKNILTPIVININFINFLLYRFFINKKAFKFQKDYKDMQ